MILASELRQVIDTTMAAKPDERGYVWGRLMDDMELRAEPSREAWLRARRGGIGASDAAACVGCSPYQSTLGLWAEKAGRVEPQPPADMDAVEMGRLLEPIVLERLRQKTGLWVESWPSELIVMRNGDPWQRCTPDGLVFDGARGVGLVQAKTARETDAGWGEEPPVHYQMQVQHEMAVTGLPYAILVVLFGGRRLEWYAIQRDEAVIEWLTSVERQIWGYVERDEELPPELCSGDVMLRAADTMRLHPDDDGTEIVLDAADAGIAREYAALCDATKAYDKRRDQLKAMLIERIGPATYAQADGLRLSLKTQERPEHTVKASKFRVLRVAK